MARGRSGGRAGGRSGGRSERGGPILLGALALLLVLFAIVFLHGRSGGSGGTPPPPPTDGAALSSALDINVYVDGSGSIQHFLEKPAGAADGVTPPNYVKEILDKTETTLHDAPADAETGAGWKDVTLRFFRFGATARPTPVAAGGGLQQMSNTPGSFTESNTRIETPVDHTVASSTGEPRAELKIIMTDLYQSGGQMERPAIALADKYLRGDTGAVGIVAVRSSFTGPVEDLPGTPRGGSLPGAADSMPFYILFAGEAPDVRHAMQVLIDGTGLGDAFRRSLATRWLFTRAPLPRGTMPMRFSGDGYSVVSRDENGTHIPLVSLGKGDLRAAWTDSRLNTGLNAGQNAELDGAGFVPLGSPAVLVPAAFRVGAGRALVPDAQAAAAARPCAEPLCVLIDRGALEKGSTYVFRFDAVEQRESDNLRPDAPAMRDWNIEVADAERISSSRPPLFPSIPGVRVGEHPGLTPDLSKFLSALGGEMFHAPVRRSSYYLYVQAN